MKKNMLEKYIANGEYPEADKFVVRTVFYCNKIQLRKLCLEGENKLKLGKRYTRLVCQEIKVKLPKIVQEHSKEY